ncbi:MAG: FAD-dependent oxidoreductase, partial [Bryobacteraceae bacterium]
MLSKLLLASALFSISAAAAPYDLIVYGGTAGGVMTAVAAAREGLNVLLMEPGQHVGGMATGG